MKNLNPLSPKKNQLSLAISFLIIFFPLSPLEAQSGVVFSGVAESTVGTLLDIDESWTVAAEQYANLRLTAPVGDIGNFFTAFNVIAVSSPETGIVTEGEIERLYTVLRFDIVDVYLGLMRIPFGYGMGIRPTDIINPQNPLFPDARLSGVVASLITWYPRDELQVQCFAVQRTTDYFEGQRIMLDGESLFGFSVDQHNPLFSIQGLALTALPGNNPDDFVLHFGLSLKFDMNVGLVFDALVTTDGKTSFAEGRDNAALAAAFGCDYSFLDGKLFLLVQYYYTSAGRLSSNDAVSNFIGEGDVTGAEESQFQSLQSGGVPFIRRHYGFLTALYSHSDYARLQLSVLASLGDGSIFPTLRHEFEPVQAVTLVTSIAIPCDQTTFDASEKGEFGPDIAGIIVAASFSVKYRF